MTTQEMTLTLDQFGLTAARAEEQGAYRMVLRPGEMLRVPRKRMTLRVLAGAAWVSQGTSDHTLRGGDTLALPRTRHQALVSAEGQTLLLELA